MTWQNLPQKKLRFFKKFNSLVSCILLDYVIKTRCLGNNLPLTYHNLGRYLCLTWIFCLAEIHQRLSQLHSTYSSNRLDHWQSGDKNSYSVSYFQKVPCDMPNSKGRRIRLESTVLGLSQLAWVCRGKLKLTFSYSTIQRKPACSLLNSCPSWVSC